MIRILIRVVTGAGLGYLLWASYVDLSIRKAAAVPCGPEENLRYGGTTFHCKVDLHTYLLTEKRDRLFPWSKYLESWQSLIIVSITSGFFGGLLREERGRLVSGGRRPRPYSTLGMLMGPSLLLAALVAPALMSESDFTVRLPSVVCVSFLGGCFSEEAWAFLGTTAESVFKKKGDKDGASD